MRKPKILTPEDAEAFYAALGRCLAAWATVDEELYRIFQACIEHPEESAIIYYRLPGLDIRLGLTDEIVRCRLPKRLRKHGGHEHESVKKWAEIVKIFRDLLSTRRRLAHHPVMPQRASSRHIPFTPGALNAHPFFFEDMPTGPYLAVDMSQNEKRRGKGDESLPLNKKDLDTHQSDVSDIAESLNNYGERELSMWLELYPRTVREPRSRT